VVEARGNVLQNIRQWHCAEIDSVFPMARGH